MKSLDPKTESFYFEKSLTSEDSPGGEDRKEDSGGTILRSLMTGVRRRCCANEVRERRGGEKEGKGEELGGLSQIERERREEGSRLVS